MRAFSLVLLLVASVVLMAACRSATATLPTATLVPEEPTTEPAASTLAGTSWTLASMNGAGPASGTSVTLQFGADGSVSGSDGCNSYVSTYQEDGHNLTFGQLAGTLMACDEAAMNQADLYREALSSVSGFTLSGSRLELLAGTDVVLTYNADVQTLNGSAWSVISYNNGREAVVSLLAGTEITLNFETAQLNGHASCNGYFAGYVTTDGNIEVQPPGSTRMYCESPQGIMEQESEYLIALQSATTFSIEGDLLRMRNADYAIAVIAAKENVIDLPEPEPQAPTGTVVGASVLHIRSGPSNSFPVIGAARQGDTGTIVGRSEDGGWWVVEAPSLPGGVGWVSAGFVTATGADNVPVFPTPPTPVPAPTWTPLPTRIPPTATPVPPTPEAQISFGADRTQINRGECATLTWDVRNIQAVWVYPHGANYDAYPRTGQGSWHVCPSVTSTYEMRVHFRDGSAHFRQVTINVAQPVATPTPQVPTPSADPLAGTRWTVVNVNNGAGGVSGLVPGTTLTMEFDSAGQLKGLAGCNSYTSNYGASGSTISITMLSTSNMYCELPEGAMQQEQQFLTALQAAVSFQITGDQLQIRWAGDVLAVTATRMP